MAGETPRLTEKVLKYLQVEKDSHAMEQAARLWNEAHRLLDMRRWRQLLPVNEFFLLFHSHARQSRAITRLLADAHRVWLMAVSLGDGLERRSRHYFSQDETFSGYILDRMGSYIVEEEMRNLDKEIVRECEREKIRTTRRYSPGYQDFSIAAQSVFLEMIGPNIPNLHLTPAGLMKPEKTITAVKGVLRKERLHVE